MSERKLNFTTQVLHTPFSKKDPHGSLHIPVYDNVAFEFDSSEEIEQAFNGRNLSHLYSRISNPTIDYFEQRIKRVTGAQGVLALSSGMAAISNLLISLTRSGENIITTSHLFGNTYSLFEHTLKPFGLNIKYSDLIDISNLESLIDEHTRIIFFETITNPHLEVSDIKALSEIARKHNLLLIADSTFTPPNVFNSKAHGVDIEILSSTKYISGGATSVGGLIIDNGTYNWNNLEKFSNDAIKYGPFTLMLKLKREVYRNLGSCLSPHNAYLQCLGLETLELRVQKSCSNCYTIATYLEGNSNIVSVNYPGLESSKYYKISKEQFCGYPGSVLIFDLASKETCFKFMNRLKLIRKATNIHDNKTLIIHPASTIFCEFDTASKEKLGIKETTIRLSAGIEDADDLIDDITNALKKE